MEQEQIGTTTQQLRYQDKIIGYNVGYRDRGQTYYTRMDHHPSDKIKNAVSVRPVIWWVLVKAVFAESKATA